MKYLKVFENYNNEYDNKFYLVIDDVRLLYKNKSFEQGILKDLKGISENEDILNILGTGCDVLIIMNKNDVLADNNIIKVIYDDINFLTKDNFKMFKRIKGYNLHKLNDYQFFISLLNHISSYEYSSEMMEEVKDTYNILISDNLRESIMKERKNFSDINDFSQYVYNMSNKNDYNKIKNDISNIIISIIKDYRYEQEWYVLNEYFKIPNNSILEVFVDYVSENIGSDEIEECIGYFKSLNNYIVKIM